MLESFQSATMLVVATIVVADSEVLAFKGHSTELCERMDRVVVAGLFETCRRKFIFVIREDLNSIK